MNPQDYQRQQQEQQKWESRNKTVVSFEAVAPSPEAFTQLAQQIQNTPGLKEVSLRRDGRTPRIRIQATQEALPHITQTLNQVVQTVQQAYASSSS